MLVDYVCFIFYILLCFIFVAAHLQGLWAAHNRWIWWNWKRTVMQKLPIRGGNIVRSGKVIWDQDRGNQRFYFRTYPYIFPRHQESKKELPYIFFIFFTFSSYSTYSFQLIHFCFMFLYHVFTFKIHPLPVFFLIFLLRFFPQVQSLVFWVFFQINQVDLLIVAGIDWLAYCPSLTL